LDASGLVLYFLGRIRTLNLENAIPAQVLERFEKNAADNRDRSIAIFSEFIRINAAFLDAGLTYVNLKGFTLVPDACPDIALRCQFDLDFYMSHHDIDRREQILKEHGYLLSGVSENVREVKAGSRRPPAVKEFYKVRSQRCIEVHFVGSTTQELAAHRGNVLSKIHFRVWNGLKLPVLPESDKFAVPGSCSVKILRRQLVSTQKNFRTCRRITTGSFSQGRSASLRR
jgi:hypothetical protein